jgi:hypothetical protein
VRLQLVLEVLGRDVLAAGGDDDVLLAVGDHEVAVLVDVADVAGVDEALLVERRPRRLFVVVVAGEDGVRPDEDLAVLGEPQLHAGERPPDRSELERARPVDRCGRRHLREPVALEHEDVDRVEELGDLAGERRAARVRDPEPAAEPLLHLRVDEAVGEAMLSCEERRHRPTCLS